MAPLASAAAELVNAWHDTRRNWCEPARHEQLIRIAGQHDDYVWLARRYREVARRGDEIASARLVLVQRAAELTLAASLHKVATNEPAPYTATRRLLIAMLGILALGLVLTRMLMVMH